MKRKNLCCVPFAMLWLTCAVSVSPCFAQRQQCDNGILTTAVGTGQITICRAVAEKDPAVAAQLTTLLDLLNKQQVQISRLVKNVNVVGQDLEAKKQSDLMRALLERLDSKNKADSADTQRAVANLTYGLDDLREELDKARSNPTTAARTNSELNGKLGDAIAQLNLTQAHDLLGSILQQLQEINGKLDRVEKNTAEIKTAVQMDLINPTKIRAALEAADMSVLSLAAQSGTPVGVIAEELAKRSSDGKRSVARSFFQAGTSPGAVMWFDDQLKQGLDPNMRVSGDYYAEEGLLLEAERAGNVEAAKTLLRRGASPHAYQDLFLTPYIKTRFLFPLNALAHDDHFSLEGKRDLAQALMKAGAVVPKVYPEGNGYSDEMLEAKELREGTASTLGLTVTESADLCKQTETPICKAASQRIGEDWCGLIAKMPKEIRPPLNGENRLIYVVKLLYLLQIEGDEAYFLGYESAHSDYVLVKVAKDSSTWTVMRYMDENYGMGACKAEGNVQPKYCWRRLILTRVGTTNEMLWNGWKQTWTLSQHACAVESSTVSGLTSKDGAHLTPSGTKNVSMSKWDRGGSLPAVRFRTTLLMLRDNPDLLDQSIVEMARWDIYGEAGARNALSQFMDDPPQVPSFNSKHPAFVYEWSELLKSNPTFALGEALDVYLRPDAPWDFLQQTPGWDPNNPVAYAGMFLFPASLVKRDIAFAAHDAAPLLKEQIQAAAKRETTELWIPLKPAAWHYDIDRQQVVFAPTEMAEADRNVLLGPGGDSNVGYNLIKLQEFGGDPTRVPGGYRKNLEEITRWREMTGVKNSVTTLALDRRLILSSIPLDREKAEAMRLGGPGGAVLKVTVFIHAEQTVPHFTQYMMYARVNRLEVTNEKGQVIATLTASQLPKP